MGWVSRDGPVACGQGPHGRRAWSSSSSSIQRGSREGRAALPSGSDEAREMAACGEVEDEHIRGRDTGSKRGCGEWSTVARRTPTA